MLIEPESCFFKDPVETEVFCSVSGRSQVTGTNEPPEFYQVRADSSYVPSGSPFFTVFLSTLNRASKSALKCLGTRVSMGKNVEVSKNTREQPAV